MTNILVGTTSWTEKTLLDSKRFYPSNATTSAARLRYYATQFRIVEVDSSYYGLIGYVVKGSQKSASDQIAAAHVLDPV